LMAFVGGAFAGAIFAFLTITMQANQNVTGLTMTIFGTALCKFIGSYLYSNGKLPKIPSNIANALQENSSNLFAQNAIVYVAIAIAIACWIYLRFSKKGLHLRAIGENPSSADAVGINVNAYKYLNVIVGGGITGIGGVYMALVINGGAWNENWINGYGWISLALVIFANWNPLVAIFGSYLFGLLGALQSLSGNFAHEFPKALGWMSAIPPDFYQMLPFLITAVILIVSSIKKGRSQSPSALGRNYYREER
ncbi:MAG: ABC transporter permease, partial [Clostridia bacterium]